MGLIIRLSFLKPAVVYFEWIHFLLERILQHAILGVLIKQLRVVSSDAVSIQGRVIFTYFSFPLYPASEYSGAIGDLRSRYLEQGATRRK